MKSLLKESRIEAHFSKWEFRARHHMTAADAESLSVRELLAVADEDAATLLDLRLGYTETWGAPDLRHEIALTYESRQASDMLCFAGGEEPLYAAFQVLLTPHDHAIVATPNYQALESIPLSICACTGVQLRPEDGWSLDVDEVARCIRPNTRMVAINFPHNPTGKILERDRLDRLVEVCRKHGLWLLNDEIYRPLGPIAAVHLPQVTDIYERAISLGGMSKAYGLPGLRIGWLASADRSVLERLEKLKHYLSISNAAPSEHLAVQALRARDKILSRNRQLVSDNLARLRVFFAGHGDLLEWYEPDGGCVSYPRYLGSDGVESFADGLLQQAGVLVMPASIFQSDLAPTPNDRFRIGFGRASMPEGLEAIGEHIRRNRSLMS